MPKIKKFRIDFISLVKEPANKKRVIYKSDDSLRFEFEFLHLRKDADKGLLFGTVYEPDEVDSQEDWTDQMAIEDAAHQFLMEKRVSMVDMNHDYDPGKGTVVESFIKNGDDPRFPDSKIGAWCVVIKLGDEAKARINEIGGLSMAGGGVYDESAKPPVQKSVTGMAAFRRTNGPLATFRPKKA